MRFLKRNWVIVLLVAIVAANLIWHVRRAAACSATGGVYLWHEGICLHFKDIR